MRWVGIRDDLASKPPAHVARGQTPLNVTRPVLVNGGANVRALIELPHISARRPLQRNGDSYPADPEQHSASGWSGQTAEPTQGIAPICSEDLARRKRRPLALIVGSKETGPILGKNPVTLR